VRKTTGEFDKNFDKMKDDKIKNKEKNEEKKENEENEPILRGLSFSAQRGQKIALVGSSGNKKNKK
jgi:ABC-type polysaccharide/polyol phosphate transport system ATPase subunit